MEVIEIGPKRYRFSFGRYLEEFEVGAVYEHRPGRTLTDADNIQFSLLTMNFHPMHCDAAHASKSEFGKSEEHTSELQSLMRISYAVFCLKKKNNKRNSTTN